MDTEYENENSAVALQISESISEFYKFIHRKIYDTNVYTQTHKYTNMHGHTHWQRRR